MMFDIMNVVSRQPYVPAVFTLRSILVLILGAESTQGTWFRRYLRKKSPATLLGIDPETLRLIAQRLTELMFRIMCLILLEWSNEGARSQYI
jgi:hypothetical protein